MKPSRHIQRGYSVHPDWSAALDNVQMVLVGTTHAGNIGAVARVMKNMGLKNLTLVSSTHCGPETDAFPMASGAYEIVEKARKATDLAEVLGETIMAAGTSARLSGKRVTALTPVQLVPLLMESALEGPVACVFGRESRGLTNEEMKLCTHHMIIPSEAGFASMNVAHAATVTAYEMFRLACRPIGFQAKAHRPARVDSREAMYAHIESVLLRTGFLDKSSPLRMMRDIRRIFNSAQLDDRDVAIIRGMFRKADNTMKAANNRIRYLEERCAEHDPKTTGQ